MIAEVARVKVASSGGYQLQLQSPAPTKEGANVVEVIYGQLKLQQ